VAVKILWLVVAVAYLAASAAGQTRIAADIACLLAAVLLFTVNRALGVAGAAALVAAAVFWPQATALLVYVPPLLVFAFMAWFFGHTLTPGRDPLITRVARRQHAHMSTDALPDEVARFTRRLTWLWSLCFQGLFLAALLLAFWLPAPAWPRWVQALGYGVPAALFLGEYAYRHRRFPKQRHAPLPALVRDIMAVMAEAAWERAARPADLKPQQPA
jgi:uncharacterized membrane protein